MNQRTVEFDKKRFMAVLAIVMIGFFTPVNVAIIPGLNYLQNVYSDIGKFWIQMLVVAPYAMELPLSLVIGKLTRRYGARRLIILGVISVTFGGIIPFFLHPYPVILFSRLLVGLGMALFGSPACGLVYVLYDDSKIRANLISIINGLGYVGNIVFMIAGGLLSDIHWSYCFLLCLTGLPILWLCFAYIPKKEELFAGNGTETEEEIDLSIQNFFRLDCRVLVFMIANTAMSGLGAIYLNNLSPFIMNNGFGNAFIAGLSGAFVSFASIFGCSASYLLYRKTGRIITSLIPGFMGVCLAVVSGSHSLFLIIAVTMLMGFVDATRMTIFSSIYAEILPSEAMTAAFGFGGLFDSIFRVMIAAVFTALITGGGVNNERIQFMTAGVCFVVLAILMAVFVIKTGDLRRKKNDIS